MNKAIGGYFGLEFGEGEEFYNDLIKVNSGRNALRLFLRENKIQSIYIPVYICDSVVQAIKKEGVAMTFYHLTENFEPVLPDQIDPGIHILYANYFGICEAKIASLKKKFENIIFDFSQAFYSKPPSGSTAFYSPRKFFGVPDGGYLYSEQVIDPKLDRDHSYFRSLHQLIRLDAGPEAGYGEFIRNEHLFDSLNIKEMSNLTRKILCSIDYKRIKNIREENFFYLHERLLKFNRIDIDCKYVNGPMAYPFRCEGDTLRDYLNQRRIFCGKYWQDVSNRTPASSVEYKLSESIIALPIDQRFTIADMKRIVADINGFLNKN